MVVNATNLGEMKNKLLKDYQHLFIKNTFLLKF